MANLKSLKKGDKVILRMFTGAFVSAKTVEMADEKRIGLTNSSGKKMTFSKESGKQISPAPKSDRFASYVEVYDPEVEAEEKAKKNKPHTKKGEKKQPVSKKAKPVSKEDDDFEELD